MFFVFFILVTGKNTKYLKYKILSKSLIVTNFAYTLLVARETVLYKENALFESL